jgi:hypothetical protein
MTSSKLAIVWKQAVELFTGAIARNMTTKRTMATFTVYSDEAGLITYYRHLITD